MMATGDTIQEHTHERHGGMKYRNMVGSIYGMALTGAAVYFIQDSATFWEGVLGFIKALFWPAVLMHKLLDFLDM